MSTTELKLNGTTVLSENNGTTTANVTDINSSNNATLKNLKMSSTFHEWTIKGIDSSIGDSQTGESPDTTDSDSGQLAIYNAANKLWGINESGWVQKPNNVAFKVRNTDNPNPGTNGIYYWNHKDWDYSNSFNLTTSKFTAPIEGLYLFTAQSYQHTTNINGMLFYVNDNIVTECFHNRDDGGYYISQEISIIHKMEAGDFSYLSGSTWHLNGTYSFFSGYLLG